MVMIYFDLMCITPHGDLPVTIKVKSFLKKIYIYFFKGYIYTYHMARFSFR